MLKSLKVMKTKETDWNVSMRWKGRNINQCMGNTEFLRCGGLYFAVAVRHSQLYVEETLQWQQSILNQRGCCQTQNPSSHQLPSQWESYHLTVCLSADLPVKSSNQVSYIIRKDDAMLAHVPVVSQHTHWHMGGYFGQFPQDVVKSPAVDNIATKHQSWVAEENSKGA